MIYLTYNDQPSGVYESQVINRIKIQTNLNKNEKIQIIAIIPLRNYFQNVKVFSSYRKQYKDLYVFPAFPFFRFWRINLLTLIILSFFFNFKKIQARGIFATYLSLLLKKLKFSKEVYYDGRGAIFAECKEYSLIKGKYLKDVYNVEKKVVNSADFCFAVSNNLIKYWKDNYSFNGEYMITPCIPGDNFNFSLSSNYYKKNSTQNYFTNKDIVIGFCGGNGSWQSYDMLDKFFRSQLSYNLNIKLLLLCPSNHIVDSLINDYPGSVINKYVPLESIKYNLLSCDYGFLVRDETITNSVASPVKFGEYMICGLKILISNNLGDFSEFISTNNLGYVISDISKKIVLKKTTLDQKMKIHDFYKDTYMTSHY